MVEQTGIASFGNSGSELPSSGVLVPADVVVRAAESFSEKKGSLRKIYLLIWSGGVLARSGGSDMVSERKQKLERKRRERELTLFFDREKRMSLRSDFQPLFLNRL